jgi:hypothetical protein
LIKQLLAWRPRRVQRVAADEDPAHVDGGPPVVAHGTLVNVSAISPSDQPAGLTVLPPDEALQRAQPAPKDEDLIIEVLTDGEWEAFTQALAER